MTVDGIFYNEMPTKAIAVVVLSWKEMQSNGAIGFYRITRRFNGGNLSRMLVSRSSCLSIDYSFVSQSSSSKTPCGIRPEMWTAQNLVGS